MAKYVPERNPYLGVTLQRQQLVCSKVARTRVLFHHVLGHATDELDQSIYILSVSRLPSISYMGAVFVRCF